MHLSQMPLAQTKRFTSSLLRQKVASLHRRDDCSRFAGQQSEPRMRLPGTLIDPARDSVRRAAFAKARWM